MPVWMVLVWLLSVSATYAMAAESRADRWQVIQLSSKERIGWIRTTEQTVELDGKTVVRSTQESRMTIRRFGQQLVMHTYLETDESPDGNLYSFRQRAENPPAAAATVEGRVEGDLLRCTTTTQGRRHEKTLPWDASVKSPVWQDRQLEQSPLKAGETRRFKVFVPEMLKSGTVELTALEAETVKDFAGEVRQGLKVKVNQSLVPGMVSHSWLGDDHATIKSAIGMLGLTLETYPVSREVALEAVSPADLDLAIATLVPVKMKNAHATRKVTYRVTVPGEVARDYVLASDTQQISDDAGEFVDVTVTAVAPPADAVAGQADGTYLENSVFLPCRDEDVVRHADAAAKGATTAGQMATQMEKYVSRTLTQKNFSIALAPADEVARNLSGDCTEHAVLLAAMLRARAIPSRVVVGMVYVDSLQAFGCHMWTEARLGERWIPFDATLGRGGIGAGHIRMLAAAFSDEDTSPQGIFAPLIAALGKMKIEVLKSE